MKSIASLVLLLSLTFISVWSNAATYEWQSQTYSNADAPYTTAMRVEASITLAAPLAANLSGSDITTDIIAWRFSDGVNVFTESNSSFDYYSSVLPFSVTTDSDGSVLSASFSLVGPDPDEPILTGNTFKIIYTSGNNPLLNLSNAAVCTDDDGLGACDFADGNEEANAPTSNTSATGPWTLVPPTSVPVPTLPIFLLLALSALLALFGFSRVRASK